MSRGGRPGINAILITGRLLNKSIPIGADIALVIAMTRIFITSTIVARGKVGIKDSMVFVLLELLLVPAVVPLRPPVPASTLLEPPVLEFGLPAPPALEFVLLRQMVPALVNR
jgi:hypothetical protein